MLYLCEIWEGVLTRRMSLLAHLALVSLSRHRLTGSLHTRIVHPDQPLSHLYKACVRTDTRCCCYAYLKSEPPLKTFSRKDSRLLTLFMSVPSSSSCTCRSELCQQALLLQNSSAEGEGPQWTW